MTAADLERLSELLLALYERADGPLREDISHVRHYVHDLLDDGPSEINDRFWMRVGEIARESGAEAE